MPAHSAFVDPMCGVPINAIAKVDSRSDLRWSCAAPLAIRSAYNGILIMHFTRTSLFPYLFHYKAPKTMRNEDQWSRYRFGSHPSHSEAIGKGLYKTFAVRKSMCGMEVN